MQMPPTEPPVQPAIGSWSADDLRIKDWSECRTTIDRFDRLLEDLRKFGFSLVTGILTASALLAHSAPSPTAIGAAFAASMVLIAALFFLDTYYQVLLSGAVERALDIEVLTNPQMRTTRTIGTNYEDTKAVWLILFLYLAFLIAALFLGLVSTIPAGFGAAWPLLVAFVALLPAMLLYWRFAARESGLHKEKANRPWPEDVTTPHRGPGRLALFVDRTLIGVKDTAPRPGG